MRLSSLLQSFETSGLVIEGRRRSFGGKVRSPQELKISQFCQTIRDVPRYPNGKIQGPTQERPMINGMNWVRLATLALLVTAAGCIVYRDPPPRRVVVVERPAPPPPAPAPAAPAVVVTEDDQVHYVVYREYFGCTEGEICILPHSRRYYAVTDEDFYFIWFVARRSNLSFDVCFRSYYYDCGRSYDRLVVTYNVPREHFFVSVGVGVTSYPP